MLVSYISVMTEISENNTQLPKCIDAFVLQWGEFGGQWGVNRSVSQIHAFLYMADTPQTADDIAQALGMARSNVSNSVKELLAWKLINRIPIRGERKDHFCAETDVWKIATRIAAVRKAKEIDPALVALKDCIADAQDDPGVSASQREKLKNMLEFTQSVDRWYEQMLSIPQAKRELLLKLGAKVSAYLPGGR